MSGREYPEAVKAKPTGDSVPVQIQPVRNILKRPTATSPQAKNAPPPGAIHLTGQTFREYGAVLSDLTTRATGTMIGYQANKRY